MTKPFAMVFPGQGSQSVGMLSELADIYSVIRETFDEASDAYGANLWAMVQSESMDHLSRTEVTQPVMLVAGLAVWRLWQQQGGPQPILMAGHSLGEYTALTASGSMTLVDALKIVMCRGQLMRDALPEGRGKMAAVIGLDDVAVIEVCEGLAQGNEWVEAVNFNAPGQVVIAGYSSSVDVAMLALRDKGAKKVAQLPISVPCHSRLMQSASEGLRQALATVDIQCPGVPVLGNIDASPESDPRRIRQKLVQQLFSPVLWVSSVRAMAAAGASGLLECGPAKVLCGLAKRIDRSLLPLPLASPAGFEAALNWSRD